MSKATRGFSILGLGTIALVSTSLFAQEAQNQSWGHASKFGVDAVKAWSVLKNKCQDSGVVVAVIDTGIDMNHPDLKGSLWVNPKESGGKPGFDDDGNGFIDDVSGWDFVTHTGRLVDTHGHGSHIAGIIGGKAGSAAGYNGICPGVKIMSLRYYNEKASGLENLKNTIRAIEYAVQNGADIINYSGGGAEFSSAEMMALKSAEEKGILVVAAAGNERSNADINLYFPAAYDLKNIISVTAINQSGQVLPSSNWGIRKVQVAAPGNSILSTLPGGSYGYMTGTSQATAFVSGVAAMMLSMNKHLTVAELKEKITSSAVKYAQLEGKTQYGAAVNALAAVESVTKVEKKIAVETLVQPSTTRTVAASGKNPASLETKKISKKKSFKKKFSAKKVVRN
jgi:subtilisin family serine protease